jgi:cellulose biosynthesis protein BcsQ
MISKDANGQIITFYSYKGGTGRSMALANVAFYLARVSRVLAIDLDLDAPGLSQYFRSSIDVHEMREKKGVLEFFEDWAGRSGHSNDPLEQRRNLFSASAFSDYIVATNATNLSLMPSGRIDASYAKRLANFRWDEFHANFPGALSAFANHLSGAFDYVLIDSRSGFSDVSGICTAVLPEKLVAVFTPNRQNLDGLGSVLRRAVDYRKQSDDIRPLTIFPLASRVETSEPKLFEQWRFSQLDVDGNVFGYQAMFESLFKELYGLSECDLTGYFDEVQVQQVPRYSYGEEVALLVERSERLSLSRSYSEFAQAVISLSSPWEARSSAPRGRPDARRNQVLAVRSWFVAQRRKALKGLQKRDFPGYAQFQATLLQSQPNANQAQLLDASRRSQIDEFGWPIGIVLDNQPDARPKPVSDGIEAEVSLDHPQMGPSYDYWAWRRNGDFYLLQSFFEDERFERGTRLAFDTRIIRLTETILYCSRVYQRLGVPGETPVRFASRWEGLKGRKLIAMTPTRSLQARETTEDSVTSSTVVPLAQIRSRIVSLVSELLSPVFMVFDFLQFSDQIFDEIVRNFAKKVPDQLGEGRLYRVDIDNLRLEVQQSGTVWLSRVYDLSAHQTVSEKLEVDELSAKASAVAYAHLYLGRPIPQEAGALNDFHWQQVNLT